MPSRHTRTRVYVAIVVTIALGFLLPPTVNLNYFRGRLSQSLSRSLGRQVSIQDVHLRLLPMPGFTFRRLQISDDDEFGKVESDFDQQLFSQPSRSVRSNYGTGAVQW